MQKKKKWIYTDFTPSTKTNLSHRLGIDLIKQISDEGLFSKIYKELSRLISNKRTQFLKWGGRRESSYLTKENIQKANKHMKRCSILYVVRELQFKTRYYHTLIKWLKYETITTPSAGKDMEQQELSFIIGGNAKQYFGRQLGIFLGNQACNPWHLPKWTEKLFPHKTCTLMFIIAFLIIAKTWKQSRCLSIGKRINKLWYIQTMGY